MQDRRRGGLGAKLVIASAVQVAVLLVAGSQVSGQDLTITGITTSRTGASAPPVGSSVRLVMPAVDLFGIPDSIPDPTRGSYDIPPPWYYVDVNGERVAEGQGFNVDVEDFSQFGEHQTLDAQTEPFTGTPRFIVTFQSDDRPDHRFLDPSDPDGLHNFYKTQDIAKADPEASGGQVVLDGTSAFTFSLDSWTAAPPGPEEICNNGIDDDGDGLVDCDDPDCNLVRNAVFSGNGGNADGSVVAPQGIPDCWIGAGLDGASIRVEVVSAGPGEIFPGSPPVNVVYLTPIVFDRDQLFYNGNCGISIVRGRQYQGSFWARSNNPGGASQTVNVAFPLFGPDGQYLGREPGGRNGVIVTNTWRRIDLPRFSDSEATTAYIGFRVQADGGSNSISIALPSVCEGTPPCVEPTPDSVTITGPGGGPPPTTAAPGETVTLEAVATGRDGLSEGTYAWTVIGGEIVGASTDPIARFRCTAAGELEANVAWNDLFCRGATATHTITCEGPREICDNGEDDDGDGFTDCDDTDCTAVCPQTVCEGDVCVTVQGECPVTVEDGVDCPGLGNFAADLRLSLVARRDATCVDISVCEGFMPPATVCIDYSSSGLNERQRERLKVIKCESNGRCELLDLSSNNDQKACVVIESFSQFALVVPDDGASFVRGDCNGDGSFGGETSDPIRLLNWLFLGGTQPPCVAACDANGDGEVEGVVTDAIYMIQFSFLGGRAPPAPYPDCGPGTPEDEALGCENRSEACR
jgi:hypothetical protein